MYLYWPLPPGISVNGGTPKESFLKKKMNLPSATDFCDLIRQADRSCFLHATDVTRAYCQLPVDPADCPHICFRFKGRFYVDVSLPFVLRWVASHCQDVTNIVSRELRGRGISLLNYIDDFGGVTSSQSTADSHFSQLQNLLAKLGLQEARHKPSPPSQVMVWMGFRFDMVAMTQSVTLPPEKSHLLLASKAHSHHPGTQVAAGQTTVCSQVLPTSMPVHQ